MKIGFVFLSPASLVGVKSRKRRLTGATEANRALIFAKTTVESSTVSIL